MNSPEKPGYFTEPSGSSKIPESFPPPPDPSGEWASFQIFHRAEEVTRVEGYGVVLDHAVAAAMAWESRQAKRDEDLVIWRDHRNVADIIDGQVELYDVPEPPPRLGRRIGGFRDTFAIFVDGEPIHYLDKPGETMEDAIDYAVKDPDGLIDGRTADILRESNAVAEVSGSSVVRLDLPGPSPSPAIPEIERLYERLDRFHQRRINLVAKERRLYLARQKAEDRIGENDDMTDQAERDLIRALLPDEIGDPDSSDADRWFFRPHDPFRRVCSGSRTFLLTKDTDQAWTSDRETLVKRLRLVVLDDGPSEIAEGKTRPARPSKAEVLEGLIERVETSRSAFVDEAARRGDYPDEKDGEDSFLEVKSARLSTCLAAVEALAAKIIELDGGPFPTADGWEGMVRPAWQVKTRDRVYCVTPAIGADPVEPGFRTLNELVAVTVIDLA